MMRYLIVSAVMPWLLAGCAPESPEPSPASKMEQAKSSAPYNANSWKTIIADSCRHFFDGCNTCTRAPEAKTAACTRKACVQYQEPRCLDDQAAADTTFSRANYQCEDEKSFSVFRGEYRAGDMRVKLNDDEIWLSDAQTRTAHRMQRVPSASGEKFSDGEFSFWSKGAEALVQQNEQVLYQGCRETP